MTCSYLISNRDGPLCFSDNGRKENTLLHLKQAVLDKDEGLIDHFVTDLMLLRTKSSKKATPSDPVITACMDIFAASYGEKIDLDMLAQRLNISKQWLIRKFKKHTGQTPMEQLNALRISKAKGFLINTDWPISHVAARCGYDSPYYFSNAFKKATDVSPLAYRNKFRI